MTIMLKEVFPIENLGDYKIHFAKWNQKNQPLDVFTKDRQEWQGWQEYRPTRDDFNRPLIFALASFYHEPAIWLFGGIFKVLNRYYERYEVELTNIGAGFIGRLKLRSPYNSRAVRVNMEPIRRFESPRSCASLHRPPHPAMRISIFPSRKSKHWSAITGRPGKLPLSASRASNC